MRRRRPLERGDAGGGGELAGGRRESDVGGGTRAREPLDQSHELAGLGVDDLGGDGVDDEGSAWRRCHRGLLDLVGVFGDLEWGGPGALDLPARRWPGFPGIHGLLEQG